MENTKLYIETPVFTGRNVPINELAKAIGKDAQYIRIGLQQGVLNFGYAMKKDNSSEYKASFVYDKSAFALLSTK